MGVQLNSYIAFNGNARQALEFYQTVFGGDVVMDTFSSYASPEMPVDEGDMNKIMHGQLTGDNGIVFMVSDTPSYSEFDAGSRITLSLNGDDEEILKEYWRRLLEGGRETMPMDNAPWGDQFGMLTDQFGINWMVNISPRA